MTASDRRPASPSAHKPAHATPACDAADPSLSPHRLEALTDGIYALAMTLRVIELKLPSLPSGVDDAALQHALLELRPRAAAWLMSFIVLARFWFAKVRAPQQQRQLDGPLVTMNVLQLALTSLMPYSSALIGEHGRAPVSQVVYSANMIGIALLALVISAYVYRHAMRCSLPMAPAAHRAAQLRLFGLIALSMLAVALHPLQPGAAKVAFALMAIVMPLSRSVERRHRPAQ